MARKSFEEVRAAFREATGVTLSGKDLEMCKAVYEAEGMMLEDLKRTKPTRQNYGLYIERLPEGKRFSHGTIDNRENVGAFVDYCIQCRKDRKLPESRSEVRTVKDENARLRKASKAMAAKIVNEDYIRQQFIDVNKTNQALTYKVRRYEQFIRDMGYDPLALPDSVVVVPEPERRFLLIEETGSWVDTSTGQIVTPEEKKSLEQEMYTEYEIQ